MSEKSNLKNYYEILEVPYDASIFDIENAYQKHAAKWHPDKHKENRKAAEQKFHDVAEAYECLSDRNSRSHYDTLLQKKFDLQDAEKTFADFFDENGMVDEREEEFFRSHYPKSMQSHYSVLGLPRNASLDDIKKAYRQLAIRYHPKNNPNNEEAHRKFVKVNEAYNALCDEARRNTYDNWQFGAIQPFRAHSIFEDFFGNRLMEMPEEEEFFRPMLSKKWSNNIDKLMKEENWDEIKDGETQKQETVYRKDKNGETKKIITTKKKVVDGKVVQSKTEEYDFPDGTRQITQTVNDNGRLDSKTWNLRKGQELPKQLTN